MPETGLRTRVWGLGSLAWGLGLVAVCAWCVPFVTAAEGAAAALRLAYTLEKLGNAVSAEVQTPGAEGTSGCVVLRHRLGNWSRFNWPVFMPVSGLEAVRFSARRVGAQPLGVRVRILRDDGTEWQSPMQPLEREWGRYELSGSEFTLFRGGDAATAGRLTLDRAIQFQVVPDSQGSGEGSLAVDEIRFLPAGPVFTADGGDLVAAQSRAAGDAERLADVLGRWAREELRLQARRAEARVWLTELLQLQASWHEPTARAEILVRLEQGDFPWQRQDEAIPSRGTTPVPIPDLDEQLRDLAALPEEELVALDGDLALRPEALYSGVVPPVAELVTDDGRRILRQEFSFTPERARQTLFSSIELPLDRDVRDRVVLMRTRLTARTLHETHPFLLRLWSRTADRGESWADFRPDSLPGTAWSTLRFDLSRPLRGVRFNPERVYRLSLRVENIPGEADDFVWEMERLALGWPAPETILSTRLLAESGRRIQRLRADLYEWRDRIARVEDVLRQQPDLRRLYAASFTRILPRRESGVGVPVPVLEEVALTDLPLRPYGLDTFSVLDGGDLLLRIRSSLAGTEWVAADLFDDAGVCVAAGRESGTVLRLPVPRPRLWQPGLPTRYTLRCGAGGADGRLAQDVRRIGLYWQAVVASPFQPWLRQALRHGYPDWSLHWNGRPYVPQVARYHWPEPEATAMEGVRLFADLGLDGFRQYGFSQEPAFWDFCDRFGMIQFASLAPSYRQVSGWSSVPGFRAAYGTRMRLLAHQADRPFQALMQVGNEVELSIWGADLSGAFPGALYHPLDLAAEVLGTHLRPGAPVMYVRAGSFRQVPPLPHEDVCGINQYTGRYSGRLDEIDRNLGELALESSFCDRPLLITEWNGPCYSWASSGIGGVTPRGAAYYLERYWRALISTPGIAGSAEFTLNWVIAPFEDLTGKTREQAWVGRPRHSQFGGGHTADHVPWVGPGEAVRGLRFRAMRAFQSPVYVMASTPGTIHLASGRSEEAGDGGRLGRALRALGKTVEVTPLAALDDLTQHDGHLIIVCPAAAVALPAMQGLVRSGVIEQPLPAGEMAGEPTLQRLVHPGDPDALLTLVSGADAAALERGVERLAAVAADLRELRLAEGAMGRILALVDPALESVYSRYILEQMARGFAFSGDDTRSRLEPSEFYAADGVRRAAWQDLQAVIIDSRRELSAAELALLERLLADGVNLVISRPAYAASAGLQQRFPASFAASRSLAESFPVAAALQGPIPLSDLGGADLAVVREFSPQFAADPSLEVRALAARGDVEVLARDADDQAVVLAWRRDAGRVILFGLAFGDTARVHWAVTHAGRSHPIYDRDTACGLERVTRALVNACRLGVPPTAERGRLLLRIVPERTLVGAGEPISLEVMLTDVEGRPQAGQLLGRSRPVSDGRAGSSGPYINLRAVSPGRFVLRCEAAASGSGSRSWALQGGIPYQVPAPGERCALVSLQFKGYAVGFTPADGAAVFVVTDESTRRPADDQD